MSSLLDFEISQKVWNAKLPIKILFDIQEVEEYANDTKWNPIFLEVSRCSYLPLLTNRVRTILSGLDIKIPDSDYDNVWYEYNHEPLRWHYPIGLLYDLYGHLIPLPWSITIHFKNLPTNSILARPTTDTIQSMFMSMIKEADFLRNGNTKKVMNLSKRDHTQLWQSIASDNYNDFWSVNKQLVEYTPSNRHIPIRLYLSPDSPVIQELVSFHDETDKEKVRTIGDVVIEIIPELSERNIQVVTHGIPLPSETPINWAYVNLCFPDSFLHLIITTE